MERCDFVSITLNGPRVVQARALIDITVDCCIPKRREASVA